METKQETCVWSLTAVAEGHSGLVVVPIGKSTTDKYLVHKSELAYRIERSLR